MNNNTTATECDTCGGSGRWESTLEDAPTVLVDLGPCPACVPDEAAPWYADADDLAHGKAARLAACPECGERARSCADPEHNAHGRCGDCCDDCRDARRIGPGFAMPMDDDGGTCPECLRSDDCECAPPVNAHRHTAPRRDSPEVLRAHLAALAYEERDELGPITNCDGCGRAFFTWQHDDDTPLEHTDDGVLCRTCAGEPFTNGTEVPRWVAWSRFSALYTPVIGAVYGDPEWVWAWSVSIPEAGREWCTDH